MTCPHCQTWILDDDHRCRRCGRRVRNSPAAGSAASFPVSAEATARQYDYELAPAPAPAPIVEADGQQAFFQNPNAGRVVSLVRHPAPAERETSRARAAEAARPEPVRQAKVEIKHARPRRKVSSDQQLLDFFGAEEVVSPPQSHIICDAPVAPYSLRIQAALIDALIMLAGIALLGGGLVYAGGTADLDRHSLPFLLAVLLTIPFSYKALWAFLNLDSFGTSAAGLRLVDFDGNPPTRAKRYQRLVGSFVSVLAAGIGVIWALVDEDALTWHDHISGTFATLAED
jgi:uncharacterized RDD family membrane protein YckC